MSQENLNTSPPVSPADHAVVDWLRLASADLPAIKLGALLDIAEYEPRVALELGAVAWTECGLTPAHIKRLTDAASMDGDKLLTLLESTGARIVTKQGAFSESYPQPLRDLPGAPPILHVRGNLQADDRFSVAIVGSRRAGSYGTAIAERFARELCAHDLCIVSGGARGIDASAHRGALAGGGRTIAFIGCGLDVPYPSENRSLFNEIVATGQGAIVSEYPFGAIPEPWRFPARNRLIAGMSLGTLVIESAINSGAMITANDAANYGRDVFAVPGPIESGRSSGCHRLIQEGAKLVQCTADILQEVGVLQLTASTYVSPQKLNGKNSKKTPARPNQQHGAPSKTPPPLLGEVPISIKLTPEERRVLDLLSLECSHVDYLAETIGLPPAALVATLTMLELKNLARRVPGNAFVRIL